MEVKKVETSGKINETRIMTNEEGWTDGSDRDGTQYNNKYVRTEMGAIMRFSVSMESLLKLKNKRVKRIIFHRG